MLSCPEWKTEQCCTDLKWRVVKKLIGTVWYFNTMRCCNIFSKDSWHSVIRQQFSKDASLKEKQDKWIMNSSDSLIPRGVWSSAVMKHDLKQLIYTFCWTKMWKVLTLLFVIQIRWYQRKSVFRNCSSTGMVVFIEQRETFWIIVGLTCGFDNLFSLTPLFFMVQPYAFELLIATLLSCVVSLLTCRSSVKRISRNRNMNGVLWVTFRLPPGVDTEQN